MSAIGFSVLCDSDSVRVEVYQPESGVDLVSVGEAGQVLVVFCGWLRYREELRRKLRARVPGVEMPPVTESDASWVSVLYRSLGVEGLTYLEGDFALVVCDRDRGSLVGFRDGLGGYPLFRAIEEDCVGFATSLPLLADRLSKTVLDMDYFAGFMMMQPSSRSEVPIDRTAYEQVHRVRPGYAVTVDVESMRTSETRVWDWSRFFVDVGGSLEESAPLYREALYSAVRESMRGTTLAHLSGGMDSTAIALLARDIARAGERPGPIHTASMVYERLRKLSGERPFVEAAIRSAVGARVHRIESDELLDFDSFGEPLMFEEPFTGLFRLSMELAPIGLAREVGADTILSGIGADEVASPLPHHLGSALLSGRLVTAWRDSGRWARARNCNRWRILSDFALPAWLTSWFRGGSELSRQTDSSIPPWVNPSFARRAFDLSGRHELELLDSEITDEPIVAKAMRTIHDRTGDVTRWSIAGPRGIRIAHPYLDPRVVGVGVSILAKTPPTPEEQKPLLRAALADVLPAEILNRRAKGHFDEVYFLGLNRNRAVLEGLLERAPDLSWEMFDRQKLLETLEEGCLAGSGCRPLQRLENTLSVLHWLTQHEERPRRRQNPTSIIIRRHTAGQAIANG